MAGRPTGPPVEPDHAGVEAGLAATRVLTGISVRAVAAAGDVVTVQQLRVLMLVDRAGGTNVATVAAALGVHPSNATRVLDRLARAELVARRPDPADRRHLVVEPTPAGRELLAEVDARRRAEISGLLAALPPGQRDTAVEVLGALAEAGGERVDASPRG